MLQELHCRSCGDTLRSEGDTYVCPSCGKRYKEDSLAEHIKTISDIFGETLAYQKEEQIANIRRNLWQAIHEQYIDSIKIVSYCRELKKILPDDFQANFYEIANSGNMQSLNKAIDNIDVDRYETYVPDIIDFMLKSLNSENLLAVNNLIERAYKQKDLITYDQYTTKFAEEAKKVDDCVYDVTVPRDVFVAYSSVDMPKVSELVEVLEEEGLSCFVAMRNLQHGRGAVGNYEKHLQEAIDNCKTVVLVSSVVSRTRSDARKVELPYIRKRDIERAPAEYGNDYGKMPSKYKKPRVEYLIEQYKGMAAESFVKEFFAGNEYRYSPREVAEAIFNILSTPVEEEKEETKQEQTTQSSIGNDELRLLLEQIKSAQTAAPASGGTNVNSLLIRAKQFLEERDFGNAKSYFNRVLDEQPNNGEAWWGLCLIENPDFNENATEKSFNLSAYEKLTTSNNYKKAEKYADNELKGRLAGYKATYTTAKESIMRLEAERKAKEEQKRRETEERKAREEAERKAKFDEMKRKAKEAERLRAIEAAERNRMAQFVIVDGKLKSYKGHDKEVAVPDGVTTIGELAFEANDFVEKIILPVSVTNIERKAFYKCGKLASVEGADSLKNVGWGAFFECVSLKSFVFPDGITSIDEDMFYGCKSLTSVQIPSTVKYIEKGAFHGCESLSSITLDGIAEIGEWAFGKCSGLKEVHVKSLKDWCDIEFGDEDANPLRNSGAKLIVGGEPLKSGLEVPSGVEELKPYVFCSCTDLTSVRMSDDVISIGTAAFKDCNNLSSVKVGAGVSQIMDNAFCGCKNLRDVSVGKNTVSIGGRAFWQCTSLNDITLGDNVVILGYNAFEGCTALQRVKLGSCTSTIADFAFADCSSLRTVDCEIVNAVVEDTSDDSEIVEEPLDEDFDNVESCAVGQKAFMGCNNLQSVKLPLGISKISAFAFENCINLVDVTLPDSLTIIDAGAFSGCEKLRNIALPNGLKEICISAFEGCAELSEVNLPSGVEKLSDRAFMGTGVGKVTVPGSLIIIGPHAFASCKKLKSVTVESGVKDIGYEAFKDCTALESVVLPSTVEKLDYSAYLTVEGCEVSPEETPSHLFAGCTALRYVTIPKRFAGFMNGGLKKLFGGTYKNIDFTIVK